MKTPHAIALTNGYQTYLRATSLEDLSAILKDKAYLERGIRLVSGNSSTGIYKTVSIYDEPVIDPGTLVDISRIVRLQTIKTDTEGDAPSLRIGAGVTLSQLIGHIEGIVSHVPPEQIRGLAAF